MACSKTRREIETGSDAEKETLCMLCKLDGDHKPAVKYCLDCNEPICQQCVDSHRRIKQINNHKIVDHMTKDTLKLAAFLSTTIKCPKHCDKPIELECMDHNVMCCLTCATVEHRNCQQVLEVACQAATTDMNCISQTLLRDLTSAKDHMTNIVDQHEKGSAAIQSQIDDEIPRQLKNLRKNINDALSKLETRILSAAKAEGLKQIQTLKHAVGTWDNKMKSVSDACRMLNAVKENGSDIHQYIAVNNVKKTLDSINADISSQGPQVETASIDFQAIPQLQSICDVDARQIASLTVSASARLLPEYSPGQYKQHYPTLQYSPGGNKQQYSFAKENWVLRKRSQRVKFAQVTQQMQHIDF